MNRNELILIWLLRLGGVVMLTALGAVVMPYSWMNAIHQQLGLGELPHVPIVGYLFSFGPLRLARRVARVHGGCGRTPHA